MIHAYVQLTITNPDRFTAYREKAGEALARHNAQVVQSSRDLTAIDGDPQLSDVGVILAFQDKDSAMSWINDPELASTHQLRRDSGTCNITLLG